MTNFKKLLLLAAALLFISQPLSAQTRQHGAETDFQALVSQADSLSRAGVYDQALEIYEKALDAEPDSVHIYNRLTKKYAFLGLFDQANTRTRELFFKNPGPSNQEWLYLEGSCLLGVYEALEGNLETALNFNVIHLAYLRQQGKYPPNCAYRIHALAGHYKESKAQLDELIRVSTGANQAMYIIWAIYVERKLGNTERANHLMQQVEQIRNAIEAGQIDYPDKSMLQYGLGLIAALEGDKKRAVTKLRRAYEMGNKQYYWWKNFNPILDGMEGEPAYEELISQIQSDIKQMKERYQSDF